MESRRQEFAGKIMYLIKWDDIDQPEEVSPQTIQRCGISFDVKKNQKVVEVEEDENVDR